MKRFLVITLLVASTSLLTRGQTPDSEITRKTQDQAAIRKLMEHLAVTWNKHDVESVRAVRSAHGEPACQPCASILTHSIENLKPSSSASGHEVEELVGAVQHLSVPKPSEYPAFSRDSP